jgi:hypothetical protein
MKKRAITFLVSDFVDEGYERPLKVLARKHDLVAIELHDPREAELPDVGLVAMRDAETGRERWIDTSLRSVRDAYARTWESRRASRARMFLASNVDAISIDVQGSYIQPLVQFFRMRERRA